eukprot:g5982.t1
MADTRTVLRYERLPSENSSSYSNLISSAYIWLSLSFVNPLLKKGARNELDEFSAISVNPVKKSIGVLTNEFSRIYAELRNADHSKRPLVTSDVVYALMRQHAFLLLVQFLLAIMWSCARLLGSLSVRWFLIWLNDYQDGEAKASEGWLWGLLLVASSMAWVLCNEQVFWVGAMVGWKMKMSMIAAVHEKLLKLNSSSVAKITSGHVVNLASNDVQRFDYPSLAWPFVVTSPIETLLILIMLSFVLGIIPAVCGLSFVLLLVPLQSLFSKQIANFRIEAAKATDKRINFMSDLISGNLAVKMLGWEDPLLEKVNNIRSKEHTLLKRVNFIKAKTLAINGYIQTIMACITFVVYRFSGGDFNVPDVLFAISLLNLPRVSVALMFSTAVQSISELAVSTKRLDDFFRLPEMKDISSTEESTVERGEIIIQNGNFGWFSTSSDNSKAIKQSTKMEQILVKLGLKGNKQEQSKAPSLVQTLTNIGFHVRPGELVGIAGKVGCGKSSLLCALLNDMENLNPNYFIRMKGSISYCAQSPWIMAATVRDNIVFGNDFDDELYNQVISSCALDIDLEQFPLGDQTEIGERGINLSGGQKARIALARAAYCRTDINLLDDPLSAVDPNVGRLLFERCIGGVNGLMKNSTSLLVTHQKQFLPLCDRIILMNNGEIEAIGTWSELANHHLLKDIEKETTKQSNYVNPAPINQFEVKGIETLDAFLGSTDATSNEIESTGNKKSSENAIRTQLVEKEGKVHGQVSLRVYWDYIVHIGVLSTTLTLLLLFINGILYFGTQLWIAIWASVDEHDQQDYQWIWVLIVLSSGVVITITLAMFAVIGILINGSTNLHKRMAKRVMHAPLTFFHRNPSGRIINRFSKDIGIQDDLLPPTVGDVSLSTIEVFGTVIIISIALPYMIPFLIAIIYFFDKIRRYYLVTSREVRRYDAVTRSPVYAMLSSNIKALPTIHAFHQAERFQAMFLKALDLNGSWWMAFLATSRWVALRLDCLVVVVSAVVVMLSVLLANKVNTEILGLALIYIVTLSAALQWWIRQAAELESQMTSVERNIEYTKLDQEPPRASEGGREAPLNWPNHGTIEYSLVTASYRPELEPALKQLQFIIPGGSSVGIVGRTGSGKSSLLLSLFRLIDITEGQILIDGIDISTIGIDVLRKQCAIIPQDPVLFGGTFRSNLDPWSDFSDSQVWNVLRRVHLDEMVKAFGGIDAPVAEQGNNLSVGQRQLLCLARALLADSKILALDEATANIDRTTDALIQDALHVMIADKQKTLLIIAHRIDTVLDCDLLLVLDGGKVVEFGNPTSLLSNANGFFRKMVSAAKGANEGKGRD